MKVIKRAMIACENSGHDVEHDFPEVRKMEGTDMSRDIILDDWALPSSIDICRSNPKKYDIDKEELDKGYEKILQQV